MIKSVSTDPEMLSANNSNPDQSKDEDEDDSSSKSANSNKDNYDALNSF